MCQQALDRVFGHAVVVVRVEEPAPTRAAIGAYSFVYAGELIGISMMFFGFRFAAAPSPKAAPPSTASPYLMPAGSATQSRVT